MTGPHADDRDRAALIAWSAVAEPGDADAGALVAALGAAGALDWVRRAATHLEAAGMALADRAGPECATRALKAHERWLRRLDLVDSPHEQRSHAIGAAVLTRSDREWPAALAALGDTEPFALYVRGEVGALALWADAVAIVGSRSATSYGAHVAAEMAASLAVGGRAVVSGGAYGIDAAAHRGALSAGGPTLAVMAGGVDRLYPAGNEDILSRIAREWAVVGEVPPGFAPHRSRFLARNRLIACAAATVVVEAAHRSGALSTARHAAALLRPVAAVPGPVTSPSSSGCHELIRERVAELVTGADHVVELVAPLGDAPAVAQGGRHVRERKAMSFDNPVERKVYDNCSRRPLDIDTIAARAGLSMRDATVACGALEARGALERVRGGWVRSRGVM